MRARAGEPLRSDLDASQEAFPALLEPRRGSEKAMTAVIQEAYIQGVFPHSLDDLVKATGVTRVTFTGGIKTTKPSQIAA